MTEKLFTGTLNKNQNKTKIYNAMETTDICQGMDVLHSGILDTVFPSGYPGDSMP